ncbi:MAG: ABC transporter permease subunit [Acholeplasmataceae bacterium]|nr:ABC transporter permease subunit [Acholeplasmataceae bacterium]
MSIIQKDVLSLEFKRGLKRLLIWSISLGMTIFLIVIIYPMVADMMAVILDMFEYLESINSAFIGMLDSFGGIPENAVEYFATEGALFLQLLGGIFAALVGFNAISRDEKERTAEVIYVLPISRDQLFRTKITTIFIQILVFSIFQFGLAQLAFLFVAPNMNYGLFWKFAGYDLILFLMIAYLSFGLAIFMKPNQSSLIAVAIPFPFYIITMISGLTDNTFLKNLKYISPFTFADPVQVLKEGSSLEWVNFLIFIILTFSVIILALARFRKRPIF